MFLAIKSEKPRKSRKIDSTYTTFIKSDTLLMVSNLDAFELKPNIFQIETNLFHTKIKVSRDVTLSGIFKNSLAPKNEHTG